VSGIAELESQIKSLRCEPLSAFRTASSNTRSPFFRTFLRVSQRARSLAARPRTLSRNSIFRRARGQKAKEGRREKQRQSLVQRARNLHSTNPPEATILARFIRPAPRSIRHRADSSRFYIIALPDNSDNSRTRRSRGSLVYRSFMRDPPAESWLLEMADRTARRPPTRPIIRVDGHVFEKWNFHEECNLALTRGAGEEGKASGMVWAS